MTHEHRRRRGFQLGRLPLELGAGPTPLLRGIAGQLHPIDGKHLAPDQALLVADGQYGGEDPGDIVAQRAHEVRDRREVRRLVAAEGDERHVLLARPGDRAAADDPARVGEKHDLQQRRRGIGGRARRVILEAGVEVRQVDHPRQQMMQGVLEGARSSWRARSTGRNRGWVSMCL